MKVECLKDYIRDAAAQADKITSKNLTLPILRFILLEAKGNMLKIRSTNLDLGIEFFINAKVVKEGTVALSGAVLANFLQNLHSEKNITFETKENTLVVYSKSNTTSIKTVPHEDFPTIPKIESGKTTKIHSSDLITGLRSVWYSSATSSMKPELSSVYIYSDDYGLVFAATDSFRLGEKKVKQKKIKEIENILIPSKNVPEIIKALESIADEVDLFMDKSQISISHKNLYITSRVIDAVFPDYKQIIPKEAKTEVIMLKEDLVSALKIANTISDQFNQVNFKIDPQKKIFVLRTKNANVGETIHKIDASFSGDTQELNFNYKYIMDCLQSIGSDSISMKFSGPAKPVVIGGVGDQTFLYLVMPMNR